MADKRLFFKAIGSDRGSYIELTRKQADELARDLHNHMRHGAVVEITVSGETRGTCINFGHVVVARVENIPQS